LTSLADCEHASAPAAKYATPAARVSTIAPAVSAVTVMCVCARAAERRPRHTAGDGLCRGTGATAPAGAGTRTRTWCKQQVWRDTQSPDKIKQENTARHTSGSSLVSSRVHVVSFHHSSMAWMRSHITLTRCQHQAHTGRTASEHALFVQPVDLVLAALHVHTLPLGDLDGRLVLPSVAACEHQDRSRRLGERHSLEHLEQLVPVREEQARLERGEDGEGDAEEERVALQEDDVPQARTRFERQVIQ
jgi:hypothetical protein